MKKNNTAGSHRKNKNKSVILCVISSLIVMMLAVCYAVVYVDYIKKDLPVNVSPSDEIITIPVSDSDDLLNEKAADILSEMSLEQKVGQMFLLRCDSSNEFYDIIREVNAGGVVMFARDFKGKDALETHTMISDLQAASDCKMLIAVDEEGGTVVRVSSNPQLRSSKFKSPQVLYAEGGMDAIKSDAEEKSKLLRSLGINMNFAPVADVCTEKSGFMYKRAFGRGAEETAGFVALVVDTMKQNSMMSCVKHFPGYGNSKADTHQGLDVNTKTMDELNSCDLVPFKRAIEHDVDSIMLTHTVINAIDSEHPASLSPKVIEMIRDDMSFEGVLVSDALDMGAVIDYSGNSGKACIMAVNAGLDLLCIPKNPVSDYKAVLDAVNSGEISQSRIDDSVTRIIKMKIKHGLYD